MRILDVNDVEVEVPNLERGYLKEESLFIAHHEAVEAVEEEGHWETVVEYPNGGRDVNWVADVPAVEAEEAWDEYEERGRTCRNKSAKKVAGGGRGAS